MDKSIEQLYAELALTLMQINQIFEDHKKQATEEQKKEIEKVQDQISSVEKVVI
jgi:hypothetical protein